MDGTRKYVWYPGCESSLGYFLRPHEPAAKAAGSVLTQPQPDSFRFVFSSRCLENSPGTDGPQSSQVIGWLWLRKGAATDPIFIRAGDGYRHEGFASLRFV